MITPPSGTYTAVLTLEQLLLLHRLIRHEMEGSEKWEFPPASHDLNYKIVEAILVCIESDEKDESKVTFPVTLNYRDCLAIDYYSQTLQDAKNASGTMIGMDILMQVFVARRNIYQPLPMAETQEEGPVFSDVKHKMEVFQNACTDDNPDNDASS